MALVKTRSLGAANPKTSARSGAAPVGGKPTLRTNALGFPTVLAESIGVISPTMTAVLIVPSGSRRP
jgi:hypothetical protein